MLTVQKTAKQQQVARLYDGTIDSSVYRADTSRAGVSLFTILGFNVWKTFHTTVSVGKDFSSFKYA